jgi:hypothetical protein
MALQKKIFSFNYNRTGTLIDRVSGDVGTNNGGIFKKKEKGQAWYNDGTNNYVEYDVINLGSEFTIVGSFNTKNAALEQSIIGTDTSLDGGYRFTIDNNTWGELRISGTNYGLNGIGITLKENEWYFFVLRRSGSYYDLYVYDIDGTLYSLISPYPIKTDDFKFKYIGYYGSRVFNGYISNINFYNYMLSEDERNELYREFLNAGSTTLEPFPKHYLNRPQLPTDYSREVDSKLSDNLISNNTFTNWSGEIPNSVPPTWLLFNNDVNNYFEEAVEGGARLISNDTSNVYLYKTSIMSIGKKYRITANMEITSGTIKIEETTSGSLLMSTSTSDTITTLYTPSVQTGIRIGKVGVTDGIIREIIVQEISGLVAAYQPNHKTVIGGKLLDLSGNGGDGTINGAVLNGDSLRFDGTANTSVSFTSKNLGKVYTISGRLEDLQGNNSLLSDGGSSDYIFFNITNSRLDHRAGASSDTFRISTININNGGTYTLVRNDTVCYLYINGSLVGSDTTTDSQDFTYDRLSGYSLAYFQGKLEELKVYNYAWTPQQARQYHNSFQKPTFVNTLDINSPVGSTGIKSGFQNGTGFYKVGEYVIEQGGIIDEPSFDATGNWNAFSGWVIGSGYVEKTTSASGSLYYNIGGTPLIVERRYKLTYTIIQETIESGHLQVLAESLINENLTKTLGTHTLEFTANGNGDFRFFANNNITGLRIGYAQLVEIPPLPDFKSGTRYLECDSPGTTAIQSKTAYGEWEFDWYKGASANNTFINIAGQAIAPPYAEGYWLWLRNNGELRFYQAGSVLLFTTALSYISANTWYRTKVCRLKSEGVFRDIPTLLSDTKTWNDTTWNSTTVGKTVIANNESIGAYTNVGIGLENNEKYYIKVRVKNYVSGTPRIGSNSITYSETDITANGVYEFVVTHIGNTNLYLYNLGAVGNYDYEIIDVKRIYPANTFTVFIKGGEFVDTDTGWTLVEPSTGSNPVTDSSYTESNYCVLDLDAGDKAIIQSIKNEVEI